MSDQTRRGWVEINLRGYKLSTGEQYVTKVLGKPVTLEGLEDFTFYVTLNRDRFETPPKDKANYYLITEKSTGYCISPTPQRTISRAKEHAISFINDHGGKLGLINSIANHLLRKGGRS